MHLIFLTRGIKHRVEDYINQLTGKYLKIKYQMPKDTELKDYMVQLNVQPVQLWSVVFPKECKDLVLTTILGKGESAGKPTSKGFKKFVYVLRKLLKLDPLPEKWDDTTEMPVNRSDIEKIAIGLKDDYIAPEGHEGI